MKYKIMQLDDEFELSWWDGKEPKGSVWFTLEEAKAIHSDLEKFLHDLWIEQHGMD